MAARSRQPVAIPTRRRVTNELPPYENVSFPPNPAAQRALAQLHQDQGLRKLDEALQEAQSALSNAAADINDRLTSRATFVEKRRTEQNADGTERAVDPEIEHGLTDLRSRVERMTQRMDENMRKMIDGRHSVQSVMDSLAGVAEDARMNASTQASTQPTRSQRQPRQGTDDSGEESDEYQDFEPTNPSTTRQPQASSLQNFQSKLDDAKTRYQSHSLTARYANNNEYRDFRRVVHDAQHPDGDQQLPHHSEWFQEQETPAPGVTTRARGGAEDDEDDDIAVSRATISTKCPLTLQELKTPLTSRKCPHSFESEAIISMIANSAHREGNRPNGDRYVQCPVTGCNQTLTRADLFTDNLLVRQIRRIQKAKQYQDEDDEAGNVHSGGRVGLDSMVIDDDGADVDDIVEGRVVPQTQAKTEPRSTVGNRTSTDAPPASTAHAIQLVDSSDEEEATEFHSTMEVDENGEEDTV